MSDTIRLIAEFFAACVGTIAFALLFQVPGDPAVSYIGEEGG